MIKFNPFTGNLDFVGPGPGPSSTFDVDSILTSSNFEVLVDQNGNVLIEE